MARFDLRSRLLVKHGVRLTSKRKVLSLMGRFATSRTHLTVAYSVLRGHLIFTAPPFRAEGEICKVTPAPDLHPVLPVQRDRLVSAPGSRQTRTVLTSLGISPETSEASLGEAASLFLERDSLVHDKSRATSLAKAKLIQRYLDYCKNVLKSRKDEVSILLSEKLPLDFMQSLNAVFRPNTRRNHAGAMVSLFECALYDPTLRDFLGSSPFLKTKIAAVKDVWAQMKRKDAKEARVEQRLKIRSEGFRDAPVMEMVNFLRDFSRKVEVISNDWDRHVTIFPEELSIMQCYVATVLSLHGQRLCAALELTTGEVLSASEVLGRFVIRIKKHKTARFHGPATVCLRALHYHVLKKLAEFRSHRGETKLLHAAPGKASRSLFAPLDAYIRMNYSSFPGTTFNLVRRTLESNAHLAVAGGTDRARADINQYLNHGRGVSELYYRYRTDDHVASEAEVVESVLSQLLSLDMARYRQLDLPSTWRGEYFSRLDATAFSWITDVFMFCFVFHFFRSVSHCGPARASHHGPLDLPFPPGATQHPLHGNLRLHPVLLAGRPTPSSHFALRRTSIGTVHPRLAHGLDLRVRLDQDTHK